METAILEFIKNYLDKNQVLVYILFNISCILQLLFPPYPGDVVLVFQGYVTTMSGAFSLIPVLINAMTGTFAGSFIIYRIGFAKGDVLLNHRFIRRYIGEKEKARVNKLFDKFGVYAIFISKFIPGINAVLILLSGIMKLKPGMVYVSIVSSVLVHHILVLLLGRFLGHNLEHVKSILRTYNFFAIMLAVVATAGVIAYKILIYIKNNRKRI